LHTFTSLSGLNIFIGLSHHFQSINTLENPKQVNIVKDENIFLLLYLKQPRRSKNFCRNKAPTQQANTLIAATHL